MKYYWEYTKENEVKRIALTAKMLLDKSFHDKYKYVLPYLPKCVEPYSIYFPELNYSNINKFWDFAEKYEFSDKNNIPKELLNEIIKLHDNANLMLISEKTINRMKDDWNEKSEVVEDFMFKVFSRSSLPENIFIFPTSFGSITSSYTMDSNLYIYVRSDANSEDITRAILSTLANKNGDIISEFFLSKTRLSEIFPNRRMSLNESTSIKLNSDSQKFLENLGFYSNNQFVISANSIKHVESGIIIKNLTNNEKTLFLLLIQNRGEIVTFEQIGDVLYKDNFDEKFSFYYVTRLISDIRRKLRDNGINNSVISTKRGSGYVLS